MSEKQPNSANEWMPPWTNLDKMDESVITCNICYVDEHDCRCEKKDAMFCLITEYGKDGIISYTRGRLHPEIITEPVLPPIESIAPPDPEETVWLCPVCHTDNSFKVPRCRNCGYAFS